MVVIHGHNEKLPAGTAKKCPFCGSSEIWTIGRNVFDKIVAEHGSACITVGCKCNAEVTAFSDMCGESNNYDSLLVVAVARWNRRADG